MKRIFAYLRIELKKGIKIIPFFIQSFLVTTVALILAIALICQFMLKSQTFDKMNIGIVIPKQETSTQMVMKLISGMESVDSVCNFSYPDEETARAELAEGKLEAAILLTENFYDDVNNGINTPVDILLAPDSKVNEVVFRELVSSGVSMLQTAQAAVYAVDDASKDYKLSMSKNDMEYEMSYLYLEYAFGRVNTFAELEETPLEGIGLLEFYLACAVTVLCGIFGFGFLSLYKTENRDFSRCLRRIGVDIPLQSVTRILVMASTLWLVLVACYIFGNLLYAHAIESVAMIFPGQIAGLFLYALAQASFMHMLFSLCGNSENGGLLYLLITIFMIVCAGGLFPISAFPVWMQKISGCFPLTYWQNYLVELLWTGLEAKTIVSLFAVILLFGGVGTFISYEKAKK